ncbi:MAG TPA: hypothetical protein VHA79_14560 [Mycobacteriales bacterium]|jgi:hypothetical protein|nr:hypothetical protein [Mycobacteriales bacterium]HVX70904.1 hypothetical protein [Mycobacteriales bacterium]
MLLTRRWSIFLVAFGVFSWVIWVTFIKNVADDPRSFTGHRPHAFFVVHLILSLVSIALGTVIGWLGWKGMRASASES